MDFDHWWKDFGQFMTPCDRLTGPVLLQFEGFAKLVWEISSEQREEDVNIAYEQGCEDTREKNLKALAANPPKFIG